MKTKRIKCQHPPIHLRLLPHAHCANCLARVTQPTRAYRRAEAERVRKAYQTPYTPDNFKEVFEDRDGGAEEYGVFDHHQVEETEQRVCGCGVDECGACDCKQDQDGNCSCGKL